MQGHRGEHVEYRNLGNSGLEVSVVGIGTNNFGGRLDAAQSAVVVNQALDEGINLFDTADVYGNQQSEAFLGAALQGKRHQAVIATKFGQRTGEGPMEMGGSRHYIMRAVEASLRRLQTDYIDLLQIHIPDPKTPHEETLRALDDLVRDGKVRYIGHSNYSGWQIAHNDWIARTTGSTPFVSAQNEYNLLNRAIEREVIPALQHFGLSLLPFFPLASGLLTGKYRRGEPGPEGARLSSGPMAPRWIKDENFDVVEPLVAFAEQRGHTMLELAMAWLTSKPYVASVIAGATKAEQVTANANAVGWKLTAEEMAEVNELSKR